MQVRDQHGNILCTVEQVRVERTLEDGFAAVDQIQVSAVMKKGAVRAQRRVESAANAEKTELFHRCALLMLFTN